MRLKCCQWRLIDSRTDAPRFNMQRFSDAAMYALTMTKEHETFYPLIKKEFMKAGVIFEIDKEVLHIYNIYTLHIVIKFV